MKKDTFRKEERLSSKSVINRLFAEGSSFLVFPYRVVYLSLPASQDQKVAGQVLFSVSKKRFKRAVDRNKLKRQMREIYRINRVEYLFPRLHEENRQLLFSIQYIAREFVHFETMSQRMKSLLSRLSSEKADA